jgi:hypothetical protein
MRKFAHKWSELHLKSEWGARVPALFLARAAKGWRLFGLAGSAGRRVSPGVGQGLADADLGWRGAGGPAGPASLNSSEAGTANRRSTEREPQPGQCRARLRPSRFLRAVRSHRRTTTAEPRAKQPTIQRRPETLNWMRAPHHHRPSRKRIRSRGFFPHSPCSGDSCSDFCSRV